MIFMLSWNNMMNFDSIILDMLFKIVSALWSESAGRLLLISAVTYFVGFSIYSGYLSWFFGGYGSVPFGVIGFSVIDIINLVPVVFLTSLRLLFRVLKFVQHRF